MAIVIFLCFGALVIAIYSARAIRTKRARLRSWKLVEGKEAVFYGWVGLISSIIFLLFLIIALVGLLITN